MDSLLASALNIVSAITTVPGLAVTATLIMVLILGGVVLQRVFTKPGK